MPYTDLFPETEPLHELREPEWPLNGPHAVDIPAVPTALGALDAASRAEFWAALALSHTTGIGPRNRKRLLDTFGSALEAVRHPEQWRAAGLREELIHAFRSEKWREPARKEWNATRVLAGTVLLWTDPRYPARLRELPDAPVRLYCRGDLSLLANPCVSIVGTRLCSKDGIRSAQALAGGLAASGVTVVSGLAVGIDRQAHLAALDLPGGTIAVLGAGPDICYPKKNNELRQKIADKGLLISEYAPGTLPDPRHFPIRNRIISGLSFGVVVVEAALRSGSLITARLALEQNRTVYAVPGTIGSKYAEGCQKLIRDGAQPVFSCADILADLSPQLRDGLYGKGGLPAPQPWQTVPARQTTLQQRAQALPPNQSRPDRPQPDRPQGSTRTTAPANPPATPNPQQETRQATPRATPANPATPEGRILTLLAAAPHTIDEVCQKLDCDPAEVGSLLIILEVRGLIRQRPDLHYALV